MGELRRGIRIPLTYESWRLICDALGHLVEKPHLDDLEEQREAMGKLLRHISRKLEEE